MVMQNPCYLIMQRGVESLAAAAVHLSSHVVVVVEGLKSIRVLCWRNSHLMYHLRNVARRK